MFIIVAVFPELDADVLSPRPILKNLIELTSDTPVPFKITVEPEMSVLNCK